VCGAIHPSCHPRPSDPSGSEEREGKGNQVEAYTNQIRLS
jgi:hypothetical protein